MFERLKNGYACKCENKSIIYKYGRVRMRKIVLKNNDKHAMTSILENQGVKNDQEKLKITQNIIKFVKDLALYKPLKAIESCPQCLMSINDVSCSICDGIIKSRYNSDENIQFLAFNLSANSTEFERSEEFSKDINLRSLLAEQSGI